jgi:preprotein translocase subunit SecB
MLAKRSPLKWHEFALLQSYFRFVAPEKGNEEVDVEHLFDSYALDIDFVIKKPVGGMRQVFAKVLVNWPEEGPAGYKLFVEAVGLFSIDGEDGMKEEVRKNLAHYSTVNMMLNRIRAHISMITATSALGSYVLPAVDVTDLFKQKAQKKQGATLAGKPTKK